MIQHCNIIWIDIQYSNFKHILTRDESRDFGSGLWFASRSFRLFIVKCSSSRKHKHSCLTSLTPTSAQHQHGSLPHDSHGFRGPWSGPHEKDGTIHGPRLWSWPAKRIQKITKRQAMSPQSVLLPFGEREWNSEVKWSSREAWRKANVNQLAKYTSHHSTAPSVSGNRTKNTTG